jgi:Hypothetical glycosyl hydrolase family 15
MKRISSAGLSLTSAVAVWITVAAATSAPALGASGTGSNEAGQQKQALIASSYFDRYGPASEGEWIPWIEEHASLITAFPPTGDWYVAHTHVPVIGYHDVYAEFTDKGLVALTAPIRAEYAATVERDAGVGYAGTFMDNINFAGANKPSPEVQSEASYREELASLIEDVRNALGTSGVLDVNTQYHDTWPLIREHEPAVERALGHIDLVTIEFGVGPNSGIDTPADYKEFTEYVDSLHERGIHVVMGDNAGNTLADAEYNLATYFLDNDGGDYISASEGSPENWWAGNDIDLGSSLSARERSSTGLWTRQFTGGVVFTLEPGATGSETVQARPGTQWLNTANEAVTEVTLTPGTGAVLRYACHPRDHFPYVLAEITFAGQHPHCIQPE